MPTALELAREGWKPYLDAARKRPFPPAPEPVEHSERVHLVARVREAARVLKSRFGVRRVVLFGSLAHEAWFMPDSDVDIAVEGLAGNEYWQAWKAVEEIIGDRPVDLIEIERVGEPLRQAIERYGVEL